MTSLGLYLKQAVCRGGSPVRRRRPDGPNIAAERQAPGRQRERQRRSRGGRVAYPGFRGRSLVEAAACFSGCWGGLVLAKPRAGRRRRTDSSSRVQRHKDGGQRQQWAVATARRANMGLRAATHARQAFAVLIAAPAAPGCAIAGARCAVHSRRAGRDKRSAEPRPCSQPSARTAAAADNLN